MFGGRWNCATAGGYCWHEPINDCDNLIELFGAGIAESRRVIGARRWMPAAAAVLLVSDALLLHSGAASVLGGTILGCWLAYAANLLNGWRRMGPRMTRSAEGNDGYALYELAKLEDGQPVPARFQQSKTAEERAEAREEERAVPADRP